MADSHPYRLMTKLEMDFAFSISKLPSLFQFSTFVFVTLNSLRVGIQIL